MCTNVCCPIYITAVATGCCCAISLLKAEKFLSTKIVYKNCLQELSTKIVYKNCLREVNTINEYKKISTNGCILSNAHHCCSYWLCCHINYLEKGQKLSVKIVYKSCLLKHSTIMIMKRPKSNFTSILRFVKLFTHCTVHSLWR